MLPRPGGGSAPQLKGRSPAACPLAAQVGQRQTVQQEEYYCHVFNNDGLVGVAFVDHDYPARAGFSVGGGGGVERWACTPSFGDMAGIECAEERAAGRMVMQGMDELTWRMGCPPCAAQVVNKILEDFEAAVGTAWRGATADSSDAMPVLEPALQKYQVRGQRSSAGAKRSLEAAGWRVRPAADY